jgi:hypothetical protein
MPIRYLLIAVNGNDRNLVCHYDTRNEAEQAKAQEEFWLDQGMYGPDDADTLLHIEEVEIPDAEEIES